MTDDLTVHQRRAQQLYQSANYAGALDEYTVLRKLRAAREGTDSMMYLSNLHSSIYCLRHLDRWPDAVEIARELSTTRDRVLGPHDSASIDAKRWWVWASAQTGDYGTASDLQVELADALYSTGQTQQAERAVATAVFYEGRAQTSSAQSATAAVDRKVSGANGSWVRSILKKVGPEVLVAGVAASFEGVVGGIFS